MVVIGPAGAGPRGRQQRRELGPLAIGEFMSLHNVIRHRRHSFAHMPYAIGPKLSESGRCQVN